MIYITGDTHREFERILDFCKTNKTSKDDVLLILGDAGINYYGEQDIEIKETLKELPITLFCIQGNHEERPENIKSYKLIDKFGGKVFIEDEYPNILFAKDSEIYDFNGNKTLVIGGAYSIDKEERLLYGYHWFKDEQPSDDTRQKVLEVLKQRNNQIDIILTHTCPFKYLPHEMFIAGVDQNKVDQSTEKYFDLIEEKIEYKNWYCGHFHTDKVIDKMIFMFENYRELK